MTEPSTPLLCESFSIRTQPTRRPTFTEPVERVDAAAEPLTTKQGFVSVFRRVEEYLGSGRYAELTQLFKAEFTPAVLDALRATDFGLLVNFWLFKLRLVTSLQQIGELRGVVDTLSALAKHDSAQGVVGVKIRMSCACAELYLNNPDEFVRRIDELARTFKLLAFSPTHQALSAAVASPCPIPGSVEALPDGVKAALHYHVALAKLLLAARIHKTSARHLQRQALKHAESALEYFDQTTEVDPTGTALVYHLNGMCRFALGQYGEARCHFGDATQIVCDGQDRTKIDSPLALRLLLSEALAGFWDSVRSKKRSAQRAHLAAYRLYRKRLCSVIAPTSTPSESSEPFHDAEADFLDVHLAMMLWTYDDDDAQAHARNKAEAAAIVARVDDARTRVLSPIVVAEDVIFERLRRIVVAPPPLDATAASPVLPQSGETCHAFCVAVGGGRSPHASESTADDDTPPNPSIEVAEELHGDDHVSVFYTGVRLLCCRPDIAGLRPVWRPLVDSPSAIRRMRSIEEFASERILAAVSSI